MGQKHNRRRTRPRSRNLANKSVSSTDSSLPPLNLVYTTDQTAYSAQSSPALSTACVSPSSFPVTLPPQWHDGYKEWRTRERRLRTEAAEMEAEQCRLFGGVPGDDVNLCYRMLEYFGGLDYIDSLGDV
ncbi:conserved hypothetical protein [Paecilomyces variotii No. 5]|uniref:Uncharacterized protein n=1 Tax=Byssochlamys spectabilis (strain No. 5 / NBRC 109023) TaxID=1356009 RepID=V5FC09_BYSSN|nr:conserved hypothetical protein [Paecilomyces variotii No. 5]